MKIVAVSDLHGQLIDIPKCDILVIAGDITPSNASPNDKKLFEHISWLDKTFRNWLHKVPAKHIVGIAGNHDFVFQDIKTIIPNLRWNYLENSSVEIEGIKFWGSPYTPFFFNWAFNSPKDQEKSKQFLINLWNQIPEDTDILVTHGPAFGKLDKVTERYPDRNNLGCKELSNAIDKVKPKYHICGHIHSGHGILQTEHTTFVNASICNEWYEPIQDPIKVTYIKE